MIKKIEVYPGQITQATLEGLLVTTKGELLVIEIGYPIDETGLPAKYMLSFDTSKKRPSYDVIAINPEIDPYGNFEESVKYSHRFLYDFIGVVESNFCDVRERYLVFKRR